MIKTDPAFAILSEMATVKAEIDDLTAKATPKLKKLEELKAELITLAQESPEKATATEGGGKAWVYTIGEKTVKVVQPGPRLRSAMTGDIVGKLRTAAGRAFAQLFIPSFNCVKNFRVQAFKALSKAKAEALIAAAEEPSKPSVTIS